MLLIWISPHEASSGIESRKGGYAEQYVNLTADKVIEESMADRAKREQDRTLEDEYEM